MRVSLMLGRLYQLAKAMIIVRIKICGMKTVKEDVSDEWSVFYAINALSFLNS